VTPEQVLMQIHSRVAAIDERTSTFGDRLENVEGTCIQLRERMALEQGRDEARDRDLAELRDTARNNGSAYGAAAGGVVGLVGVALQAAWHWLTGGAPAPGN